MTTATAGPSNWNLPNALTVLRILMVPVFALVLLSHPHDAGWRIAATAIFVLAIATDAVDGHLARSRNLVTDFGKLADPIADKALTGMAFVGLSIIGELYWWVTALILLREWGITLMRLLMAKHFVQAANRGGKAKTLLQSVTLALFLLPLPLGSVPDIVSWVLMWATLALTLVTGVDYLLSALRKR